MKTTAEVNAIMQDVTLNPIEKAAKIRTLPEYTGFETWLDSLTETTDGSEITAITASAIEAIKAASCWEIAEQMGDAFSLKMLRYTKDASVDEKAGWAFTRAWHAVHAAVETQKWPPLTEEEQKVVGFFAGLAKGAENAEKYADL